VDLIAERKKSGNLGNDWLGTYISKPSYDGKLIDERSAIIIPFDYSVGNGGSGVFALNFGLWMIAKRPEVQEKLYKEIMAVVGERDITFKDLHDMKYLNGVMHESLRYFPPGGHVGGGRKSMGETVVEGYLIPVNTTILIQSYLMQHNPRYFPDPENFIPERWDSRPEPDYAFATFGAGKMGCAGQKLARLQMAVNLAHIIRAFTLQTTDNIVLDVDYIEKHYFMGAFEVWDKPPAIKFYPRNPPKSK
jgi:hypothetical protein